MFTIQNILTAFLFIIHYFQFVDVQRTMSIDDVLKIKNEDLVSFYCKNVICVETDVTYEDETISIPDKYGNITTYIANICTDKMIERNVCFGVECNADSDCLSNKCANKHCVYNQEEPVMHCDSVYSFGSIFVDDKLYMHCGKAWGYDCQSDDECSSQKCNNGCTQQIIGPPEDNKHIGYEIALVVFLIWILPVGIIIGISICCCRHFAKKAKNKYRNCTAELS